jgi:hypothetical protein
MAVLEKKPLSLDDLESQVAFELPERELMQTQTGLVNLFIGNLVVVVPIAVAATICGVQVGVLAVQLQDGPVECEANSEIADTRIRVTSRH